VSAADEIGPARRRISDKLLKAAGAAKQAAKVDVRKARAVLGTRLVLAGLAGVCLAGGIDYFQNAEAIKDAVTGIARETGHSGFAAAVDDVDRTVQGAKQEALLSLPVIIQQHLSTAALALGLLGIGIGTRIKMTSTDEPGRSLRDIGRVIAAPGFVGMLTFNALLLRSARLRTSFGSFANKLFGGELSWEQLQGLTGQYAPWAWREVGSAAVLGGSLAVVAVVSRLVPIAKESPWRPKFDFLRKVTFWAGLLLLGYYAAASAAAVASYGSALSPYLTWPWRLTPGAFLTTILFMSVGIALARTGTAMMKRARQDGAEAAAA
jgi:hypothetical protein